MNWLTLPDDMIQIFLCKSITIIVILNLKSLEENLNMTLFNF